jgi:hypothetical protein
MVARCKGHDFLCVAELFESGILECQHGLTCVWWCASLSVWRGNHAKRARDQAVWRGV